MKLTANTLTIPILIVKAGMLHLKLTGRARLYRELRCGAHDVYE